MSLLPWLTAAAVVPPVLSRWRRRDNSTTLLVLAGAIGAVGLAGLLSVTHDWQAGWFLIVALPILGVLALLPPESWGAPALSAWLRRHRRVRGILLALFAPAVFLGCTEWTIYLLVKTGALELADPVRTILPKGTEDWRRASVIGDHTREPDPVLFWRPRPIPPYNAQRFQGPIVEVPKPAGTFRIICYGDSNTDGHMGDGGWPRRLGALLERRGGIPGARRVEVLNAGIMGYSSHQGLMRCREEIGPYEPDLVFVSFGWNDAPLALGKPDREFAIPPSGTLYVQRFLLRFRFYRLLCSLLPSEREPTPETGPRVPIDDYVANLREFARLGREHGARVVYLTRPHRDDLGTGWRASIPDYNAALRSFARGAEQLLIDVQQRFAGRADLFADECHFTAAGHDRMAEILHAELLALLH